MLTVMKFGGSSLNGELRLRHSADIVREARRQEQQVALVVSAMGESTDELLEMIHKICPRPSKRELDALLSSGEQQSAAVMAILLSSMGVPSLSLTGWQAGILSRGEYGDADISALLPYRAAQALAEGCVPVVAGFQGLNDAGDICTLGRGGSDTTAVALAHALGADRCLIYSDVDGIYTADPRLVPAAIHLEQVDARDMLILARGGSQVLHAKSVELALCHGVEPELLSSFGAAGRTRLCLLEDSRRPAFAGLTRSREAGSITVAGRGCTEALLPQLAAVCDEWGIELLGGHAGKGFIELKCAEEQQIYALRVLHKVFFEED